MRILEIHIYLTYLGTGRDEKHLIVLSASSQEQMRTPIVLVSFFSFVLSRQRRACSIAPIRQRRASKERKRSSRQKHQQSNRTLTTLVINVPVFATHSLDRDMPGSELEYLNKHRRASLCRISSMSTSIEAMRPRQSMLTCTPLCSCFAQMISRSSGDFRTRATDRRSGDLPQLRWIDWLGRASSARFDRDELVRMVSLKSH